MSSYDDTKNAAAQKSEENKNYGQQKAGDAQDATKVQFLTIMPAHQ